MHNSSSSSSTAQHVRAGHSCCGGFLLSEAKHGTLQLHVSEGEQEQGALFTLQSLTDVQRLQQQQEATQHAQHWRQRMHAWQPLMARTVAYRAAAAVDDNFDGRPQCRNGLPALLSLADTRVL
jgi:hypothetical protein